MRTGWNESGVETKKSLVVLGLIFSFGYLFSVRLGYQYRSWGAMDMLMKTIQILLPLNPHMIMLAEA
jgi:hypothetical protein